MAISPGVRLCSAVARQKGQLLTRVLVASCVFVTQTLNHFHLSSKVNTLTSLSGRLLIQRNISI